MLYQIVNDLFLAALVAAEVAHVAVEVPVVDAVVVWAVARLLSLSLIVTKVYLFFLEEEHIS